MSGAHPNFSSQRFDETAPTSGAIATEMTIDLRTPRITNEFAADGTMTLAATTAIYTEYARTLQALAQSKMDPSLPRYEPRRRALRHGGRRQDATTWKPAAGCTGLEEIIIPTADNGSTTARCSSQAPRRSTFCADPFGVYNHCGYDTCDDNGNNCVTDKLGLSDTLWVGREAARRRPW